MVVIWKKKEKKRKGIETLPNRDIVLLHHAGPGHASVRGERPKSELEEKKKYIHGSQRLRKTELRHGLRGNKS